MTCVRIVFAVIAGLVTVQGILARSTVHNKNEDNYIARENDIANSAPLLPIQGGLPEPNPDDEGLEELYNMRGFGMQNTFNLESPYESVYNMERFYDVDNPFYIGSSYFSDDSFVPSEFEGGPYVSTMDLPEGTIISESFGQPQEGEPSDESGSAEDNDSEVVRTEDSKAVLPYWTPPVAEVLPNSYMMAIPAQLQSFPMFNPENYQQEYDEYEEKMAADLERERQEKADELRNSNIVAEENDELQGRRVRRGLSRHFHLRNKVTDSEKAGAKGLRDEPQKENVVLNNHADCGTGRGGGRRGNGNDNAGGTTNGANGVNDATQAVQGAANQAAGAANQAADAANQATDAVENAAENLRLANGRRGGRQRNGNNGRRQ